MFKVIQVYHLLCVKSGKLKEYEVVHRQNGNLLALRFKDKRDVTMLSSFHEPTMSVLTRQRHETDEHIRKPGCIVEYTKKMGGVDLCDQLNQYNTIARKTKKWWRKLLFHLMNVCMVNAFGLYSKFSLDERKKDHRCFRISGRSLCARLFQIVSHPPELPECYQSVQCSHGVNSQWKQTEQLVEMNRTVLSTTEQE